MLGGNMCQAVRINEGFRTFIDDISGLTFQYHLVQNDGDHRSDIVHANICVGPGSSSMSIHEKAFSVLKSYTDQFGIRIASYNVGSVRKVTDN